MKAFRFKPVDLPCEFDFTISRGTQRVARHVFVELDYVHNGTVHTGYGEATPCEFYGETQETVLAFYETLQTQNFWQDYTPFDLQRFQAALAGYTHQQAAKAGLEMAVYDLLGKIAGLPLYKLWGLNADKPLRSSYTIGLADLATVRHKTQVALDRGYDILKVKVGGPANLEILAAIRELAPPPVTIRVDATAAWEPDDALGLFPALVEFNVEFVEEPLKLSVGLEDRLRVKAASPLPIIADESVHTLRDIPNVAPWAHGVNLKLTKTGGLGEALRMIHAARAHDLRIMLGCFVESSLAITAMAHLAPLVDYLDLDGGLLLAHDPVQGLRWEGNQLFLPPGPGLGITVRKN